MDKNGSRQPAVIAMLCSISKPLNNDPALLYLGQVKTLFHEFGHVLHLICSEVRAFGCYAKIYEIFLDKHHIDSGRGFYGDTKPNARTLEF